MFLVLYLSPVRPIYHPPQGGGLFRETCSPQLLPSRKAGQAFKSPSFRPNYSCTRAEGRSFRVTRAPPVASLMTSSRSAVVAQPRPLNTGFPGCPRRRVAWGRGLGQSRRGPRGGREGRRAAAARRGGPCCCATGRAREGRWEGTWRSSRPGRDPRLRGPFNLPSWHLVSLLL